MPLALTRVPSPRLAECELTCLERVPIDLERAREQHAAYRAVLGELGCEVVELEPLPDHPDGVFVEDTALVLDGLAVMTRPGAASRRGELPSVAAVLRAQCEVVALESVGSAAASANGGLLRGVSRARPPARRRPAWACAGAARRGSGPPLRAAPGAEGSYQRPVAATSVRRRERAKGVRTSAPRATSPGRAAARWSSGETSASTIAAGSADAGSPSRRAAWSIESPVRASCATASGRPSGNGCLPAASSRGTESSQPASPCARPARPSAAETRLAGSSCGASPSPAAAGVASPVAGRRAGRRAGRGAGRGRDPRAERRRRRAHQASGDRVEMRPERSLVREAALVHVPEPRPPLHRRAQERRAALPDRLRERRRDLVAADRPAGLDLVQHVAPPLQAHLRDERLLGQPGRAPDLDVEGVDRPERRPRAAGRGHDGGEPVRIAALDDPRAGVEVAHAGRTTSCA